MSSEILRTHLTYYQKVLTNDPEHIEAHLRLAEIFRELGNTSHATEQYVTVSKLLAKEGLPLEAIAACKAVLELDPSHTEIQSFLARLFAQIPSSVPRVDGAPPSATRDAIQNPDLGRKRFADAISKRRENASTRSEASTKRIGFTRRQGKVHDDEITGVFRDSQVPKNNRETVLGPEETFRLPPAIPTQKRKMTEAAIRESHVIENVESFEINVFDIDDFELDVPSEEIDFSFLEELEMSLGEGSPSDTNDTRIEVNRHQLPRIPLFSKLDPESFVELLNEIKRHTFSAGEVLLSPTANETELSILIKGKADVTRVVDGKVVLLDTISEGEFFGEFRLLTGLPGTPTITSQGDVEILTINERMINAIAQSEPDIWDILWEFYQERMLNNLLATGPIFKSMDSESRLALGKKFSSQELVADELLLEPGEPCDFLYLVLAGEVVVERDRHGLTEELAALKEGEFLGVASTLDEIPYIANVRAVKDTTLLCLPAEQFRAAVKSSPTIEEDVKRFVISRRKLNDMFTSGMTGYGDRGIQLSD